MDTTRTSTNVPAETLETLLRKLDDCFRFANDAIDLGHTKMHGFWAHEFHATAELLLSLTGIDHRRRYAAS